MQLVSGRTRSWIWSPRLQIAYFSFGHLTAHRTIVFYIGFPGERQVWTHCLYPLLVRPQGRVLGLASGSNHWTPLRHGQKMFNERGCWEPSESWAGAGGSLWLLPYFVQVPTWGCFSRERPSLVAPFKTAAPSLWSLIFRHSSNHLTFPDKFILTISHYLFPSRGRQLHDLARCLAPSSLQRREQCLAHGRHSLCLPSEPITPRRHFHLLMSRSSACPWTDSICMYFSNIMKELLYPNFPLDIEPCIFFFFAAFKSYLPLSFPISTLPKAIQMKSLLSHIFLHGLYHVHIWCIYM